LVRIQEIKRLLQKLNSGWAMRRKTGPEVTKEHGGARLMNKHLRLRLGMLDREVPCFPPSNEGPIDGF
jgi:hypothetical protein